MISVILVTHNRLHLLELCVERVLSKLSGQTREIIIWNNASTDATRPYLDQLTDVRLHVVHHDKNIGTNAYARACALATQPYLIELDDDIIDAPDGWDLRLLQAFQQADKLDFLAANVVDDGKSIAAQLMYREWHHMYTPFENNGVPLLAGPTGGYCTITSRAIYDAVGGFREDPHFVYWHEDAAYAAAVQRAGYGIAVLADLKVFHASGPAYSSDPDVARLKDEYFTWRAKRQAQRDQLKRVFERIPPIRWLNRRLRFYTPGDRYSPGDGHTPS